VERRTQKEAGAGAARRPIVGAAPGGEDHLRLAPQSTTGPQCGTLDTAALDAELRAILLKEVISPEQVEIEFKRVMDMALAM